MKTEHTPNHYEQWCMEWQKRFLTLDQEKLVRRIPGLKAEGEYLTILYYLHKYGIRQNTGEILSLETQQEPAAFTRLNLYTLLWYCKQDAVPAQEWLPFRNLKNASPFGPAFQKSVIDVFAETFSGHMRELETACLTLGGRKLPHSDAGYQIPAFECIPIQYLFWDKDEEFPAQANILFDRNAVDFIHVESLVTIASEGLSLLTAAAGLTTVGNTFS